MNYSISNTLKCVSCICVILLAVSCNYKDRHGNEADINKIGIYYNMWSKDYGYGLQYVIMTKDSLYVNVLQTRDSALVNINRWYQPYAYVRLRNFVPIGIQWKNMVCYLDRDSNGYVYGNDSIYIYEHGIDYMTELEPNHYYNLFYDPDQDLYTFYKTSFENLQKKGIVPSKCKAIEDVEKQLCINDSCVFDGIRKMSKSELMTLLWGE